MSSNALERLREIRARALSDTTDTNDENPGRPELGVCSVNTVSSVTRGAGENPDAPRTAGEIVFDISRVFGPGLTVIVGGLAAPARPTARTRPRSSRTGESGGPSDAA